MNKTEALVYELSESIAAETGLYIYSVEYLKEGSSMTLRVYIDKDGGADINSCEQFSRRLSAALDDKDPITGAYNLEVSTPGIERRLSLPWHFKKYTGNAVTVRLFKSENGKKQLIGILKEYLNGSLIVTIENEDILIDKTNISAVNLYYEW